MNTTITLNQGDTVTMTNSSVSSVRINAEHTGDINIEQVDINRLKQVESLEAKNKVLSEVKRSHIETIHELHDRLKQVNDNHKEVVKDCYRWHERYQALLKQVRVDAGPDELRAANYELQRKNANATNTINALNDLAKKWDREGERAIAEKEELKRKIEEMRTANKGFAILNIELHERNNVEQAKARASVNDADALQSDNNELTRKNAELTKLAGDRLEIIREVKKKLENDGLFTDRISKSLKIIAKSEPEL